LYCSLQSSVFASNLNIFIFPPFHYRILTLRLRSSSVLLCVLHIPLRSLQTFCLETKLMYSVYNRLERWENTFFLFFLSRYWIYWVANIRNDLKFLFWPRISKLKSSLLGLLIDLLTYILYFFRIFGGYVWFFAIVHDFSYFSDACVSKLAMPLPDLCYFMLIMIHLYFLILESFWKVRCITSLLSVCHPYFDLIILLFLLWKWPFLHSSW